jgi:hypothetical protein
MIDRDGLYLENTWVCGAEEVATTYQGNDLSKPATLQASYSYSFTLPDSLAIRRLTQNAEQLDSGSRYPYKRLTAQVIQGGETTFLGIARLTNFNAGWEVNLFEAKKDLFTRLDRSIRTADLSAYNHPWTREEINLRAGAKEGVCYPMIDYGLLRDGEIPLDTMFPATYVSTIIRQMLREEGYTLVGDLPNDAMFKRLVIPFSESDPTNYDEDWQKDRYAKVTFNGPDDQVDRGAFGSSNFIDRTQPYNLDNLPDYGVQQGKLHNYNTSTYSYVCDTAMNCRVQANQILKITTVTGSVEIILSVEKNGQMVASNRIDTGSGYNLLGARTDTISLNAVIPCKKGDQLRIHLTARRRTATGRYKITIYNNAENSYASYSPEIVTDSGDVWRVNRNLPDSSGKSLMVALAYLYGGNWIVDGMRNQVRLVSLTSIINGGDAPLDWSNRIDTGSEPGWAPRLDPYAQANLLTWKELDETKKAGTQRGKTILPFGDGVINVNAETLEAETTLFEMPFAGSIQSKQDVPGYGLPVSIKLRSTSGSGANLTINNESTEPRLLLVSHGDTFPVASREYSDDQEKGIPVTVNLQPAWYGQRPDAAVTRDTNFCLSFGDLPTGRNEISLIRKNYGGLIRVLRRARVLTLTMRLRPADVGTVDFARLIRLQRVQVGSLVLSDGLYYLNKIEAYKHGRVCEVTLIAF